MITFRLKLLILHKDVMLQPWKVIVIHTDQIIFHIATVLQIVQALM